MDFNKPDFLEQEFDSDLQKNLFYLGICLVLVAGVAAANNVITDTEDVHVGPVEITYECVGLEAGICLGIQKPTHETHNYEDYEPVEEGTEDYYRRVEAELMIQAYRICEDKSLEGMDWLEEAEYENRTGDEWYEMDEVELLGCEDTFRFQVDE